MTIKINTTKAVKFGCATIDKSILVSLYNSIKNSDFDKITFSKEQIKQIPEYYTNK